MSPEHSPSVTMFLVTGLGAVATIVNFTVSTSATSPANSGIYLTSCTLFGLIGQEDAPKVFSQLSRRHVSRNALLLSCVLLLSMIIPTASGDSTSVTFTLITLVPAMLFTGVWVVIVVSYLICLRKCPHLRKASTFRTPGGTASAWLILGFIAIMVAVFGLFPDTRAGSIPSLVRISAVIVAALMRRHHMLRRAEIGQLEDS